MKMTDEQRRKQYDNWNRYYQRHKQEINARRKKVREDYKNRLTEAKELISNLIRVTWGEGWSYSLDWKVKAERFLKE